MGIVRSLTTTREAEFVCNIVPPVLSPSHTIAQTFGYSFVLFKVKSTVLVHTLGSSPQSNHSPMATTSRLPRSSLMG